MMTDENFQALSHELERLNRTDLELRRKGAGALHGINQKYERARFALFKRFKVRPVDYYQENVDRWCAELRAERE